jgi:hypothetical protein
MNLEPAAGIIPYIKLPSGSIGPTSKGSIGPNTRRGPETKGSNNTRLYFLLGYEKNSWSGFVGGYESTDGNIVNTAIREFNEETAGIFKNNLSEIKNQIISNQNSFCITTFTKNRTVYLYFVQMSSYLLNQPLEQMFLSNKNKCTDEHYKEKNIIKWFNLNDLHKNKILYSLKKEIFNNLSNF